MLHKPIENDTKLGLGETFANGSVNPNPIEVYRISEELLQLLKTDPDYNVHFARKKVTTLHFDIFCALQNYSKRLVIEIK